MALNQEMITHSTVEKQNDKNQLDTGFFVHVAIMLMEQS